MTVLQDIEQEIIHYQPKTRIANFMRELGKRGFGFSGHGTGFGSEHFGLANNKLYVAIEDTGNKTKVIITRPTWDCEEVFTGTIGGALKFIKAISK